jgi:hypothetical protein
VTTYCNRVHYMVSVGGGDRRRLVSMRKYGSEVGAVVPCALAQRRGQVAVRDILLRELSPRGARSGVTGR